MLKSVKLLRIFQLLIFLIQMAERWEFKNFFYYSLPYFYTNPAYIIPKIYLEDETRRWLFFSHI